MAFQPRPYGLVSLPAPADPLRSLSDLASVASQFQYMRAQRDEDLYRQQERARVKEDRQILASAQSSELPPKEVEAQLKQFGRGDLVPVYKTWRTDLDTARLGLKRLTEEDQARTAERVANYWGAHASALKRAKYDPLALEAIYAEAERDGYPAAELRAQVEARQEQLPTIVEDLIQKSPVQREILEKEAAQTLSQTRQSRLLQESREREAEAARTATRLEQEGREREIVRREQETQRAHEREMDRIAAGRSGALSEDQRARIEQEYADGMNVIDEAMRPQPSRDFPENRALDRPGITSEQATIRRQRLTTAYERALGMAAPRTRTQRSPGQGPAWVPPAATRTGDGGVVVGAELVGRDGQRVRITKVYPDGSFDADPVR